MGIIIGVRFKKTGKMHYMNPLKYEFKVGDVVVAPSERGTELGRVVSINEEQEIKDKLKDTTVDRIIKPATKEDFEKEERNKEEAKKALKRCKEIAKQEGLLMKLIHAEYTLDMSKLIFYFVSEDRVDFRELVKELASEFRARIEIRQVGPRDEIKSYPSVGMCGREVCCRTFLPDFESVTIKMAKEQGLQINMPKLSGNCGRLMCCLKYEESVYREKNRSFPKINERVKYNKEEAKVIGLDILRDKVKLKVGNIGEERFEIVDVKEVIRDNRNVIKQQEESAKEKETKNKKEEGGE